MDAEDNGNPADKSIDPDTNDTQVTDDTPLKWTEKLKIFFVVYWRGIAVFIIPIIFLFVLTPFPPEKYQWCAYVLCIMAMFWVTECIPLAVTSFIPMILFPLTGVLNTTATCKCYINDTVMMFLGSLILASSVEQSGLHNRLALFAIRSIGYSHYKLLFAMCFITMFVSMWVTNTAATTMMVPINFALLKVFEDQNLLTIYTEDKHGDRIASDITTCYFCAATFSATVGGIGTLVGTATNLVFKGLFEKTYSGAPEYLSFPKFSCFAIPYMLCMEIFVYIWMLIVYLGFLRPKSEAAKQALISPEGLIAAKETVLENTKRLGRFTFWETMVVLLFSFAMLLFICRSPQIFYGWGDAIVDHFRLNMKRFVLDSSAAMLVCFLMFLLPSSLVFFNNFKKGEENLTDGPVPSILDWTMLNEKMPWSFIFLLGGGFALSTAAEKQHTDLNGRIGVVLTALRNLPNSFVLLLIIVLTTLTTNFASNVAVCNIIAPIAMQVAMEVEVNPLWYNIAAGFSASYAFMLPVGTPGNLVVQGAADIPTGKMIRAGSGPTVICILLSWFFMYFWAPVLWPDLPYVLEWAIQ